MQVHNKVPIANNPPNQPQMNFQTFLGSFLNLLSQNQINYQQNQPIENAVNIPLDGIEITKLRKIVQAERSIAKTLTALINSQIEADDALTLDQVKFLLIPELNSIKEVPKNLWDQVLSVLKEGSSVVKDNQQLKNYASNLFSNCKIQAKNKSEKLDKIEEKEFYLKHWDD